jgi:hypothetical protein
MSLNLTDGTAGRLFGLANTLAMTGWIALAVAPNRRLASHYAERVVPGVLCVAYAALALTQLPYAAGDFSSLAGVASLFRSPGALLAGWVHYLAFDLLVGAWEARDARARGVTRWALVPCLFLTFMLGPVGLLAYLGVRRLTATSSAAAPASASADDAERVDAERAGAA